jgi:hypothetical protein
VKLCFHCTENGGWHPNGPQQRLYGPGLAAPETGTSPLQSYSMEPTQKSTMNQSVADWLASESSSRERGTDRKSQGACAGFTGEEKSERKRRAFG